MQIADVDFEYLIPSDRQFRDFGLDDVDDDEWKIWSAESTDVDKLLFLTINSYRLLLLLIDQFYRFYDEIERWGKNRKSQRCGRPTRAS